MASPTPLVPASVVSNDKEERKFAMIDNEIERLKASILTLKNERNTIAPISKLPPELLCHIFYFASQDTTIYPLQWIQSSHVCSEWRNSAVNCPSLWTNLPLQHSRWTDEMLIRSKVANLTLVNANPLDPSPSKLLHRVILHHMCRIEHLSVKWMTSATELLKIIPRSAPMLETLVLEGPLYPSGVRLAPNFGYGIPEDSLCEMARIYRMELTGIHIDWNIHLHNTLTVLKLHYGRGLTKPTEAQFWDALDRMPLLENLDLQDCLPLGMNPRRKIHFKTLRTLTICSRVEETEHLLEGIGFPAYTVVSVTCHESSSSNFARIASSVASRSRIEGPQTPMVYLDMYFFLTGARLSLQMYSFIPNDEWDQTFISLDFSWDPSACRTSKVLKDLFRTLSLEEVQEVRVADKIDQISPAKILQTVGTLRQLRKVTVISLGPKFLDALQKTLPTNTPGRVTPSFPNLHTLTVDRTTFRRDSSERGALTAEMLLDCLMARCEYGAAVQRLQIENCEQLWKHNLDSFREVVVNVEWDGLETGYSESDEDDDDSEDMYGYEDQMYYGDSDEYMGW